MWKYFKDKDGQVFPYKADGSQDAFIKPGLTPITEAEADELRKPKPLTPEQRIAEIDAELLQIDADSIRAMREKDRGRDVEYNTQKIDRLDADADALRDERTALTSEASALRQELATLATN